MILQALKEYYDRKVADPDSGIAPEGWIRKGIDFAIAINENGDFIHIACCQEREGSKAYPMQCLVPSIGKQAMKHTNAGNDANLLWDNSAFVFGLGKKGEIKLRSFLSAITDCFAGTAIPAVEGVKAFLKKIIDDKTYRDRLLQNSEYGDEINSGKPTLTFKIAGDSARFIFDMPDVRRQIETNLSSRACDGASYGICLVTGEKARIQDCHTVIKGVWGAQTSGATIVGFNKAAFCSFQKEQGFNAPVGRRAAEAYITAINHLLAKDSEQNMHIADISMIFWSEKNSGFEKEFARFFGEASKDDPDRNTRAVQSLFNAPQSGAVVVEDGKIRFYVLGMAPNASRISIRLWTVDSIAGMADKIRQYFYDLRISHGEKEKEYLSLFRLLSSTSAQGKADNIPPNLAGETIRSILEGLPYPETLLQAAIRRNKAEQSVTYPRAALIKACINRKTRFYNPEIKEELKMSLDKGNKSIGYRLGRLFAVLVKNQEDANNASTIRDSYYGAASSTPSVAFGTLMRLSKNHLSKIGKEKAGLFVVREKLIGEIIDGITDFPSHLPIAEQGRFAVGYYHQMQDFYAKKEDKN